MNCIDCSYSLIKDGHSNCTYEEGECIKINVLEKENTELEEDLRNKKLGIQNRNGRIKELEEKISVLLSCKNCPENKGGLICQKEYEDKCLAQKIQYIKELQQENADLEKENAELKEEMKAKQVVLNDFKSRVETVTDRFNKKSSQLARAREILRGLYFIIQSRIDYENNIGIADEMARAEQFLNEVSE